MEVISLFRFLTFFVQYFGDVSLKFCTHCSYILSRDGCGHVQHLISCVIFDIFVTLNERICTLSSRGVRPHLKKKMYKIGNAFVSNFE